MVVGQLALRKWWSRFRTAMTSEGAQPTPLSGEVIPRVVYQTWHSLPLPKYMAANNEALRAANSDFRFELADDAECRAFLAAHFPRDVCWTFDQLVPGAYRADLWRYCVLWIHGGVYLDIKFGCTGGFKLKSILHQDWYVRDRDIADGNYGVYQGFLVSRARNPVLDAAIADIVRHTVHHTEFLRGGLVARSLRYTGPLLLARSFLNSEIAQWRFWFDGGSIRDAAHHHAVVLYQYGEYRQEQREADTRRGTEYYRASSSRARVYAIPTVYPLRVQRGCYPTTARAATTPTDGPQGSSLSTPTPHSDLIGEAPPTVTRWNPVTFESGVVQFNVPSILGLLGDGRAVGAVAHNKVFVIAPRKGHVGQYLAVSFEQRDLTFVARSQFFQFPQSGLLRSANPTTKGRFAAGVFVLELISSDTRVQLELRVTDLFEHLSWFDAAGQLASVG